MIRETTHIGNPLQIIGEQVPAIRDHLDELKRTRGQEPSARKDEGVLGHVLQIPKEFLPPKAWSQAEKLQHEGRTKVLAERAEYFGKLRDFLGAVVNHSEQAQSHWLHILEHGEAPEEAQGKQWSGLCKSAFKRRAVFKS